MKYTIIDEFYGNSLKDAREIRGMTLQDLADKLGIPKSTYVCYEKGTRSMPMQVFLNACAVLHLDAYELIRESQKIYLKSIEMLVK